MSTTIPTRIDAAVSATTDIANGTSAEKAAMTLTHARAIAKYAFETGKDAAGCKKLVEEIVIGSLDNHRDQEYIQSFDRTAYLEVFSTARQVFSSLSKES